MLILNGVLMTEAEATLPATDRALTHGLGLYETLKLVGGVPVFFEEHVARLVRRHRGARAREAHRQARAGRADLPSERGQRRAPTAPAACWSPPGAPDGEPVAARADRPPHLPAAAAARDHVPRRARQRPVQGDDRDAVVPRAAGGQGRRRGRRAARRRRGPHLRGRDVQRLRRARRRPHHAAGRGRHPARRAARQGRAARDRRRHPRRGGVGARRRPAPGRRRAAHEQRPRRRARWSASTACGCWCTSRS